MIRVLQMASLSRGGLETFIMNVYRKIDRSKIQFDFLTTTHNGDYADDVRSLGGYIYEIPARNQGFFTYYKNLDTFFREHAQEYQAVHLHIPSLSLASSLYFAKKYGIRTRLMHAHSSSISTSKLHYLLHYGSKPFVRSWATHYLGCSDKALDWFYKYTGVRGKALMINNGIDVSLFRYNLARRSELRQKLALGDNVVIGHVGRFVTVKNHRFLIEIFSAYHNINPNAVLMLVGDGELMGKCQAQVKKLGLGDKVLFMGLRTDVHDLLQAMDIFIMPSFFEGLPVVLVEAQTSALPIIVADVISQNSKLTDNFYYMSLKNDAKTWAKKADDILYAYTRHDTSKEIINKGFDINTTVKILTEIYTSEH